MNPKCSKLEGKFENVPLHVIRHKILPYMYWLDIIKLQNATKYFHDNKEVYFKPEIEKRLKEFFNRLPKVCFGRLPKKGESIKIGANSFCSHGLICKSYPFIPCFTSSVLNSGNILKDLKKVETCICPSTKALRFSNLISEVSICRFSILRIPPKGGCLLTFFKTKFVQRISNDLKDPGNDLSDDYTIRDFFIYFDEIKSDRMPKALEKLCKR